MLPPSRRMRDDLIPTLVSGSRAEANVAHGSFYFV